MRYLGVNQHFQTKIPVSEFDGLEARLNVPPKVYKIGRKRVESFSMSANFSTARSSDGGNLLGVVLYTGITGTNASCTIYQTRYTFDVSRWQSSFQLNGAVVELVAFFNSSVNNTTTPSKLYLLGVRTKFTEYKGWTTMSSSPGFANLGELLVYPPNGSTVNQHHGRFYELMFLSFRITNLSGLKSLLDAAAGSSTKEIYLYPMSYHYVENRAPTADFYFYDGYCSIGSFLELYYT